MIMRWVIRRMWVEVVKEQEKEEEEGNEDAEKVEGVELSSHGGED